MPYVPEDMFSHAVGTVSRNEKMYQFYIISLFFFFGIMNTKTGGVEYRVHCYYIPNTFIWTASHIALHKTKCVG